MLATATGGDALSAGLAARNVPYRINQNTAGQNVSLSFAQGEHLFEGTELSPAYSIAGMNAQIKANRQARQFVPVVQQPKPATPEQRPVAVQPPAPELKPEPPKPEAPTLKPRVPKRGPKR